MSIWSDIEDRSDGVTVRKEDIIYFWDYGKNSPYKGTLDSETEKILSDIYSFRGFAPFLPSDILENEGTVKVFLDDKETRRVPVSLKALEDERDSLEKEVEKLKKLLNEFTKTQDVDPQLIENLSKRISKLERKIEEIDDIIRKMKRAGINAIDLEVELLGYYVRKKAEIHLMMGTINERYGSTKGLVARMTGIVFVHELMHAYFDVRDPYVEHPDCRSIEEPIAEYGMLSFMEMFERYHAEYAEILNTAKDYVEEKKDSLGVCHYGFGRYLFDNKASFGVDWVSLYRSTCTSLLMNASEVLDYGTLISPIRYPRNERSCECRLWDVLKPRRFFSRSNKACWRKDGSQLYLNVKKDLSCSPQFVMEYPETVKVKMKIFDKKGCLRCEGEMTLGTRIHFFCGVTNPLLNEFARCYGLLSEPSFSLYEEKPSDGTCPAEWVAIEDV